MSGKRTGNSGNPGNHADDGTDCSTHKGPDDVNDEPKLDPKAQELIGRQLKVLYGSILDEPVPDQFVKLLEDLERQERGA